MSLPMSHLISNASIIWENECIGRRKKTVLSKCLKAGMEKHSWGKVFLLLLEPRRSHRVTQKCRKAYHAEPAQVTWDVTHPDQDGQLINPSCFLWMSKILSQGFKLSLHNGTSILGDKCQIWRRSIAVPPCLPLQFYFMFCWRNIFAYSKAMEVYINIAYVFSEELYFYVFHIYIYNLAGNNFYV